jgi:hypothetical protein
VFCEVRTPGLGAVRLPPAPRQRHTAAVEARWPDLRRCRVAVLHGWLIRERCRQRRRPGGPAAGPRAVGGGLALDPP